jgi:chromosome partitioning protein
MALIIAACGQKGGSGKSQTIRALSAELARKKKIVVIDLDTAQRTVSEWAEARATNKIEPAITVEVVDPDDDPDFRIPELSKGVDYVLCDAPGWSDALTLNLASWADLIVLPSEPSVDDLRPTIRLYFELVGAGIESERIVIVLNRKSTETEIKWAREYLKKAEVEDHSVLSVEIPDHAVYRKATNVGQAITEVSNSSAKESANAAVKAILKTLVGLKKRAKPRQTQEAARFTLKEGESW